MCPATSSCSSEDIGSEADTEGLARRICDAFDSPFVTSGSEITITASVGIAFAGPGETITDQLVTNADVAMYQAKRRGGAGHQIIDLRAASKAVDDDRLEDAFRRAFSNDELHIAYQPIVRTSDGSIIGVEALLRWTDPQRGVIPTMSMIVIAEHNGLINDVGAWVLDRACRDHVELMRHRQDSSLELAVNVSALQLMAPGFCASVARILADTGLDPSLLILEMTETIFIADGDRAMTVIADLRAMNVQLALDDFGTGYSSLSYLRAFPVDIIKIDRSFIADLGHDPANGAIVASLIQLAHVLGLKVTVEGVETRQQNDQVRAMGPEAVQGYFYGRPVPAEAIGTLLAKAPIPAPAQSTA